MALNQLIAQGGTNIQSPVRRYLDTRKQMEMEKRNQLAMAAQQQQMQAQNQTMQMERQKQKALMGQAYAKAVTPIIESVNKETNKQDAWSRAYPEVERIAYQHGIPLNDQAKVWDQNKAESFMGQYGKKPEGTFINALTPSRQVVPARVVGGLMYDPKGQRQPTWIKAPSQQETVEREGWGTDTQIGGLEVEHLRAEEDTYKLVNNLDSLKDFVTSDNYIGGTTGDIISTGNSIVQQFKNLSGLGDTKGAIPLRDIGSDGEEEYSSLREAAILGDRKSSLVIELAYNIAKSFDRGGRVTDADFKFAQRLIDGSADIKGTIRTIDDFRERSIKNYNASDTLFSDKWKRDRRQFNPEKYRTMYDRKKPPAPTEKNIKTEIDSWIQEGR